MSLRKYFKEVESVEFALNLNVLSGFRSVQNALEESEVLSHLIEELAPSLRKHQQVMERITTLLNVKTAPDVEHPSDAALAGYLHVLDRTDKALALAAARQVADVPNLWWARRLAEYIAASVETTSI